MIKIAKYLLGIIVLLVATVLIHWYNPEGDNLDKIRAKYHTPADRIININGVSAHYRISGQGETLILIHGNQDNCLEYDEFRAALDKKYQVVAIDLMGHGLSGNAVNDDYSLANFNRYVETLIDSIHITRASIMGHSLGGYLAMQYTMHHPDRIDKLILLNSFGGMCPTSNYSGAHQMQLEEYPGVETFTKYFLPQELVMADLREASVSPPKDSALIFDILSVNKRRMYMKYLNRTFTDFDRSIDISGITKKTLIITSDLDNAHTPCEAENLASRLPNDTLVMIHGAKHGSLRDKPAEIIKVVEDFLGN